MRRTGPCTPIMVAADNDYLPPDPHHPATLSARKSQTRSRSNIMWVRDRVLQMRQRMSQFTDSTIPRRSHDCNMQGKKIRENKPFLWKCAICDECSLWHTIELDKKGSKLVWVMLPWKPRLCTLTITNPCYMVCYMTRKNRDHYQSEIW